MKLKKNLPEMVVKWPFLNYKFWHHPQIGKFMKNIFKLFYEDFWIELMHKHLSLTFWRSCHEKFGIWNKNLTKNSYKRHNDNVNVAQVFLEPYCYKRQTSPMPGKKLPDSLTSEKFCTARFTVYALSYFMLDSCNIKSLAPHAAFAALKKDFLESSD